MPSGRLRLSTAYQVSSLEQLQQIEVQKQTLHWHLQQVTQTKALRHSWMLTSVSFITIDTPESVLQPFLLNLFTKDTRDTISRWFTVCLRSRNDFQIWTKLKVSRHTVKQRICSTINTTVLSSSLAEDLFEQLGISKQPKGSISSSQPQLIIHMHFVKLLRPKAKGCYLNKSARHKQIAGRNFSHWWW